MQNKRQKTVSGKPPYVDRPEVQELYVDSLYYLFFDGRTVRLEFAVHRPETTASGVAGHWAYTACRVVMTNPGIVDMLHQMAQLQARIEKDAAAGRPTRGPAAAENPAEPSGDGSKA